jgi:nucleotide-binding universal stress UspA family protein
VNPAWRYPTAAQLAFELRHPEQVRLTARSERLRRDSFTTVLRRRFQEDSSRPGRAGAVAGHAAGAPIVAVAIDLADTAPPLAEALRTHVAQILGSLPGARVACLNVLKQGVLTLDSDLDTEGRNKVLQRLVELRHWAGPLDLEEGRVSFHVLESPHPAAALLRYARDNRVDHIILGARAASTRRTLLGSVSGEVAAHAPCTVTVVRLRRHAAAEASGASEEQDGGTWTVG